MKKKEEEKVKEKTKKKKNKLRKKISTIKEKTVHWFTGKHKFTHCHIYSTISTAFFILLSTFFNLIQNGHHLWANLYFPFENCFPF